MQSSLVLYVVVSEQQVVRLEYLPLNNDLLAVDWNAPLLVQLQFQLVNTLGLQVDFQMQNAAIQSFDYDQIFGLFPGSIQVS